MNRRDRIKDLERTVAALGRALELECGLLEPRMAVIRMIPPCPAHGPQCLPWAEKWIDNAKKLVEVAKKIEWIEHDEAFFYCPDCHSFQENGHGDDCDLTLALTPLVMGE